MTLTRGRNEFGRAEQCIINVPFSQCKFRGDSLGGALSLRWDHPPWIRSMIQDTAKTGRAYVDAILAKYSTDHFRMRQFPIGA